MRPVVPNRQPTRAKPQELVIARSSPKKDTYDTSYILIEIWGKGKINTTTIKSILEKTDYLVDGDRSYQVKFDTCPNEEGYEKVVFNTFSLNLDPKEANMYINTMFAAIWLDILKEFQPEHPALSAYSSISSSEVVDDEIVVDFFDTMTTCSQGRYYATDITIRQ
jgi:hypothetical protein